MTSRYLEAFQKLQSSNHLELIGDILILERLPDPGTRKVGSLHVQDSAHARGMFASDSRPHLALVVATGKGYYNPEDGKAVDLETKPGDIVVVGNASVKYFTSFGDLLNYEPDTLGITRESDVQMRFKGSESYAEAFAILNGQGKEKASV